MAGDFRGLIERATGEYVTFERTPGGAGRALETVLDSATAQARDGAAYAAAEEELALLEEVYGASVDMETFLGGVTSPGPVRGRAAELRGPQAAGRGDRVRPAAVRAR